MIRKFVPLLLAIIMTACSTNGWLIASFYNRVDTLVVDRFTEYADFNEPQLALIQDMAESYHGWHRASELPRYAAFMREIVAVLSDGGPISRLTAQSWIDTSLGFSVAVESCNPLNNAVPLLTSLTDDQVLQIAQELESTYVDYVDELESRDPQQRRERRFKIIRKWLGRVGLRLNTEQQDLLRTTIAEHRPFQREGLDLWRVWNGEFVALLQARTAPDFEPRMAHHMVGLWNLSKDKYPRQWHANYQLWIDFFHRLLNMQTDQQRARFSGWLVSMADTLEDLANPADPGLLAVGAPGTAGCGADARELAGLRQLQISNNRPTGSHR